jgi:hypothetical protein
VGGATEDAPHVWVCQGRGANDLWDKALLAFETWCDSVHTDPELTKAMISGLQNWWYGHPFNTPTNHNVYCTISQQSDIGWGNLLEGWMVIEWETLQQEYYDLVQSRRTGASWSAMLLQRLWRISRALWEHRNEILHQQENIVTQVQELSLHRKIQRQYVDLSQMSLGPEDSYLCSFPIQELLKKSWVYKSEWSKPAEIVIARVRKSRTSNVRNLRHMRGILHRWLRRSNSN